MIKNELRFESEFDAFMSEGKSAEHLLATGYLHFKPEGKFKDDALLIISNLNENEKNKLFNYVEQTNDKFQIIERFYKISKRQFRYHANLSISKNVSKLIAKLLNVKDNEEVFDLGSGIGEFLFNLKQETNSNVQYRGIEINSLHNLLCSMVFDLLDLNYNFKNGNGLIDDIDEFDKGFTFPTSDTKNKSEDYVKNLRDNKSLFNSRTNIEWFFVDKLLSKMKKKGKAIALLYGKPLYFAADEKYRNSLLDNKLLEGIIELPAGALSPSTTMQATILVFSHNNEKVKIINGEYYIKQDTKERKTEIDFDAIYRDYTLGNYHILDNDKVKEKGTCSVYNLITEIKEIRFGEKFSNIADISQGSQYTIANFRDKITERKTDCRILTSSDIDNGYINWDNLAYIDNYDMKLLKHRIQKNDLIMTSKSSKIKIAVVDFEPTDNIIVTGGLFKIRPKTELINPTFLKMFLESDTGISLLKSIQKGTSLAIIPPSMLKKLCISCPAIEKQNFYAEEYKSKLNMYIEKKKELEELEEAIKKYYINNVEE